MRAMTGGRASQMSLGESGIEEGARSMPTPVEAFLRADIWDEPGYPIFQVRRASFSSF